MTSSPAALRPSLVAAAVLLLLSWLTPAWPQDGPMRLPVDPAPLVFQTPAGERSLEIEIADDANERARGLMFREDLPDDRGMLFVFEETRPVGFWMQNTPLPLDLVFIDGTGVTIAILPGEPFSTATISPGRPARFVLEVKRGIAAANGIAPGTRFAHPAIAAVAP